MIVYCQHGCGCAIGLKSNFCGISYIEGVCPNCRAMSDDFRPEKMALEPVILKVTMYGIPYNVTYPSEQRVSDLRAEFVTMCKGALKPCGKRQFLSAYIVGRTVSAIK